MRWKLLLACVAAAIGCSEDGDFNIFTVQDDIDLGGQLRDEIASNPADYPILDEATHPEAYQHLYRIRDEILASGQVNYHEEFEWETYIIEDDEVLNAFCAPGGFIYVYTGLVKFLEEEDEFAGVLGHEIAHADRRHSTDQLTKAYGLQTLVELALGEDPGLIAEIAQGLVGLSFSRTDEAESDEYSVRYLCQTDYAADGAAGFFEKLDGAAIPEFLSTHPSSENRVEELHAWAADLGCSTEINPEGQYSEFLASLP